MKIFFQKLKMYSNSARKNKKYIFDQFSQKRQTDLFNCNRNTTVLFCEKKSKVRILLNFWSKVWAKKSKIHTRFFFTKKYRIMVCYK